MKKTMLSQSDVISTLQTELSKAGTYASKSEAQKILNAVLDSFEVILSQKEIDGISLVKRFSIEKSVRDARTMVNQLSSTKETIEIPAKTTLKFKPSKVLLDKLNNQ